MPFIINHKQRDQRKIKLLEHQLKQAHKKVAALEARKETTRKEAGELDTPPVWLDSGYESEQSLSSSHAQPPTPVPAPEGGFTWVDNTGVKQADWNEEVTASPDQATDPWGSAVLPEVEKIQVQTENTPLDDLVKSSRLEDKAFLSTPAGHVPFSCDEQGRLLEAARVHAQQAFADALRQHDPHSYRKCRHGHRMVRFGRNELMEAYGYGVYSRIAEGVANGASSVDVESATNLVVDLRNALSHPGFLFPRQVDEYMQYAQRLVVVLGDEDRAIKIRALRDEAHGLCQQGFDEIVKSNVLTQEPSLSHQELFRKVHKSLTWEHWREKEISEEYGVEVVKAARDWNVRYEAVDEERLGFKAGLKGSTI